MALIKDSLGKNSVGAQYMLYATGEATVDNLGVASDEVVVFELPANALLTGNLMVHVTEAFDGTTPTLDVSQFDLGGTIVGSALDTAIPATVLAVVTTALSPAISPEATYITVKLSAADSTTGAATVTLGYVVEGRANENAG